MKNSVGTNFYVPAMVLRLEGGGGKSFKDP